MKLRKIPIRAASAVTVVLALACGQGTGPEKVVLPPPSTTIQDDPSFDGVVQEIFERRGCQTAECHGTRREGDLDLRRAAAWANLVSVVATEENVIRVIPGNADGSYLVIKLEDRQGSGEPMPFDEPALDPIDLTHIKNWINQGAKQN
jgi:hypothetical protein